jgi:cob(I)alamin adenosyltransferase
MTKVYTKVGDDGFTLRGDGQKVPKSDARIEAGGAVDELNAHLGLCLCQAGADKAGDVAGALEGVQDELMTFGSMLAGAITPSNGLRTLDETALQRLERLIDSAQAGLPELRRFLVPWGSELACRLHVARTVCRRAERAVVGATHANGLPPILIQYLNRLSDLLFMLVRRANQQAGLAEERWQA